MAGLGLRDAAAVGNRDGRVRLVLAASAALATSALMTVVMPRESGASSTPRFFGSSTNVAGILGHPVKAGRRHLGLPRLVDAAAEALDKAQRACRPALAIATENL